MPCNKFTKRFIFIRNIGISVTSFLISPTVFYDPCSISGRSGSTVKIISAITIIPSNDRNNMICCLSGTIAVVCLMILSVIGCFFPCLFGCMVRHNYGTISYDIGFYYRCLRCISKEKSILQNCTVFLSYRIR